MTTPTVPRLAVGHHDVTSGYACAMNLLCWEQGEPITDNPRGVAPYLADAVRTLNDNICTHVEIERTSPGRSVKLLCPPCSTAVLSVAHRVAGTATDDPATVEAWATELLTGDYGLREDDHVDAEFDEVVDDLAAGRLPESIYDDYVAVSAHLLLMTCPLEMGRQVARQALPSLVRVPALRVDLSKAYLAVHAEPNGAATAAAAHRLVDAWEAVTGRHAPDPSPDVVRQALHDSGATR